MLIRKRQNAEEVSRLKAELEKIRSQFYVFHELTKAMRTTLLLDEVSYIILTGLTAQQGLGFNRALFFVLDKPAGVIRGFMGIGPLNAEEAGKIWKSIKKQKMNLYALIENYHRIKEGSIKSQLMEFIRSLELPIPKKSGIIRSALKENTPLHIRTDGHKRYTNDIIMQTLKLEECVVIPLWLKNNPFGMIVVDNHITKKPITDEDIKTLTLFINQATGALENSKMYETTLMRSHTDTLTSLWNHGYFQYRLDEELLKAESESNFLSLVMIDIDDFKKFNDTLGHLAGDEALREVAEILQSCSRKIDVVCRYGGEEFILILPRTSKEESKAIGERIRTMVSQKTIFRTTLTVSIGVAAFPLDAVTKADLIARADSALYRAKNEGKNRVVLA